MRAEREGEACSLEGGRTRLVGTGPGAQGREQRKGWPAAACPSPSFNKSTLCDFRPSGPLFYCSVRSTVLPPSCPRRGYRKSLETWQNSCTAFTLRSSWRINVWPGDAGLTAAAIYELMCICYLRAAGPAVDSTTRSIGGRQGAATKIRGKRRLTKI